MRLTRREFLAAALSTPIAAAAGGRLQLPGRLLTDALRAELGFPIPHRLFHGESSVAAARRVADGQHPRRERDGDERPAILRPLGAACFPSPRRCP